MSNELSELKYDSTARDAFVMQMWSDKNSSRVDLQFPPKITSDSKKARWEEKHNTGYEEYAVWLGSYARTIGIELNYVVWGKFSVEKIQNACRDIKLHLYAGKIGGLSAPGGNTSGSNSKNPVNDRYPFIEISGWEVLKASGKAGSPRFRVMGIDLSYGKEYVGSGINWWPQHTKIKLSCKLASNPVAKADSIVPEKFESGTLAQMAKDWA